MQRAVRRLFAIATLFWILSAAQAFGQAATVLPREGAGHQAAASCLILERAGTVDKVTSRVLSLGIHGKQFEYVEGKLPEGSSFHDKFTERDVRELQAHGSEVVIVSSDLMPDELQQAREYCRAETRKAPVQAGTSQVEISSTPAGSDIELDGKFIGSTPSTVKLPLGDHTVKLSRNGYATWERTITTVPGSVVVSPELEPVVPTKASSGEIPAAVLATTASVER
jgi:hypothetical protein